MTEEAQAQPGAARASGMATALVLGGSGFIGCHLLRHLRDRLELPEVFVAGSGTAALSVPPGITSIGDTIEPRAWQRIATPDVVFWAMGGSSVAASMRDPALDFERSIPPLAALLELLRGPWQGARLVFISSAAVYGQSGSQATRTASPLLPISPYGVHKKRSEEMIQESVAAHATRCTIVRPFSVYGPGLRRQLFWDALEKHGRGDHVFHGTGEELRDWLYVDDLVALLADVAIAMDRFPTVLNAGTGVGITVSSALHRLYSLLPAPVVPAFAGASRAGDPDRLVACPAEQEPMAGYFRTSFDEGLRRYVAWHGTHRA
jgi:UDP-glucose 4-epimerase